MKYLISVFAFMFLTACGGSEETATSSKPAHKIMPADPALAELYQQTCMACHSRGSSGAPQTGNTQHWQTRLAKGMDTLLNNTIDGFRGMPPMGSCMDCGEEEFTALINFMSSAAE